MGGPRGPGASRRGGGETTTVTSDEAANAALCCGASAAHREGPPEPQDPEPHPVGAVCTSALLAASAVERGGVQRFPRHFLI